MMDTDFAVGVRVKRPTSNTAKKPPGKKESKSNSRGSNLASSKECLTRISGGSVELSEAVKEMYATYLRTGDLSLSGSNFRLNSIRVHKYFKQFKLKELKPFYAEDYTGKRVLYLFVLYQKSCLKGVGIDKFAQDMGIPSSCLKNLFAKYKFPWKKFDVK